jgi:WD40 repeat protein/predicted Ser/Thr protein kinase
VSTAERHARLTQLFGEAIELDANARLALIDRVRGEDIELAKELAELLDVDAKATAVTALVPATELDELRRDATPGTPEVPGYRIGKLLGEGGMGTVYAAEQDEPRRRVAIKILHARSQSALARFEIEAAVMAKLDHPGIARVLEAGEAHGRPFLAMDYIDGEALDVHVQHLPVRARLQLFVAICDAVHHAHVKGVFHRDLKPANIRVRRDGSPVVLDFGVARLADDASSPIATRAGELIGTPLYMSPEQARLEPQAIDARGDVYTLGVILYELCANALPYGDRRMPMPALTRAIIELPPKRVPELRGDLEAIVDKALEKDPARHYPSVAAFADDVRHYLAGEPVSVRVPGTLERARRFVRRRPWFAGALVAIVLATATFAAIVTSLWLDARSARDAADAARARTEQARSALSLQHARLVLRQARDALGRDPTEALALVATAGSDGDAGTARAIADEAHARGVADVLQAHTDEVHWIEPLERGFVTGAYDGRAIVWAPDPHVVFTAKHGRVHAVTHAGDVLAIGADDGVLQLVTRAGQPIRSLAGLAGDVSHVAWSDATTGEWLAAGDDHGNALLWNHGGDPSIGLLAGTAGIGDVTFGGGFALAGDKAGHVVAYELATGTWHTAQLAAGIAALWSDGTTIAAADAAGTLHRLKLAGDKLVETGAIATGVAPKRAVFDRRGALVLGGVSGAVVRVDGDVVTPILHFDAMVRSLAVRDDGALAAGSDRGELVYVERDRNVEHALRGGGRVRHLAFARDGNELLASDSEGAIRRWNVDRLPHALLASRGAMTERLAATHDMLAAVDANGDVSTWDLRTGVRNHAGHVDGYVVALALANGVAVTGSEANLVVWSDPPVAHTLHGHITAIATTADRIAVASSTGAIAMFTARGEPAGELAGHAGGTETLAFDARGKRLASAGQDRSVRVWQRDGDTFVAAAALSGPTADTYHVAWAGEQLVSAGNDGTVLAWRSILLPPRVIARHTGAVLALGIEVAGSDAGIVSAGRDGRLARGADSTTLPAAATVIAVHHGDIHALLHTGAIVRWTSGAPVVEIEHGVHAAVPLDDGRWVLAFDDGTVLVSWL